MPRANCVHSQFQISFKTVMCVRGANRVRYDIWDSSSLQIFNASIRAKERKRIPYASYAAKTFTSRYGFSVHSGCEHSVVMDLIKHGLVLSIIPFKVDGDYRWEAFHAELVANR
jgi:hypothetical protein